MLDTSVMANKSVKYEVDRQILDHFKALHFKWKIMNNDKYTQRRSTVYALLRQHHTSLLATSLLEPLTIQALLLLRSGQGEPCVEGGIDSTVLMMNSLLHHGCTGGVLEEYLAIL